MSDRDQHSSMYREMFERHPLARTPQGERPGAACEVGWLALIDRALTELDAFGTSYEVRQIKEKMGDLRLYIWPPDDLSADEQQRWRDIVDTAEARSRYVCETCGRPGRLRKRPHGWYLTACEEHADSARGYAAPVEDDTLYRGRSANPGGKQEWERYDPELDGWVPEEPPR
ncbi:hypothetical protein ACTJK5_09505 [Agrobacterium sp. 22094]|uniref:hypothetical protein n=1 Tax=Agrobacterium sp. 22094 TaxID=3453872 RepID=UPI003F84E8BB